MNNISHALFSRSLLCFPSRVRFVISLLWSRIFSCCWIIAGCLQFIPLSCLSFTRMLGIDCLSFLVSHLLYTSVSLVSFPFEYIIHGLPVMNNISHALFSWNPLLIFPSWARFVFFVESNIHPLTSLCFGWWVFWHIYQSTFSVDHLLYASVSLVFLTMRVYYLRSDGNR